MQRSSAMFEHVRLAPVYTGKQWKSSAMERKNASAEALMTSFLPRTPKRTLGRVKYKASQVRCTCKMLK